MNKIVFLLTFICVLTLFGCANETLIITFETNGGNLIEPVDLSKIENFNIPTPVKENYIFLGWFLDSELTEQLTSKTPFDKSITLYAKWRLVSSYTITYDSNGGSSVSSDLVSELQQVSAPTPPLKEGHSFIGWYTDENLTSLFLFNQKITENMTLYAKWEKLTYSITFNTNGGSPIAQMTFLYDYEILIDDAIPTLPDYAFDGWYLDELLTIPFDLIWMPAENLILYAKWKIETFTISFETDGGNLIDSINLPVGSQIVLPSEPQKDGYIFSGWYLSVDDLEPFDLDVMPNHSFVLYADYATEGLIYDIIDGEIYYEVSIGSAIYHTEIQIPKRHEGQLVTKIKSSGFAEAFDLLEIKIPISITSIGNNAFYNNYSLKEILIPKNVDFIGERAFMLCADLETILVDEENEHYVSIDGILFSKDMKSLVRYPSAKTGTTYLVPNSVETIEVDAFGSQKFLLTVDLGSGVKTIKSHAFYRAHITSIDIPNQVTLVELYAFRDCFYLESVNIGTGLTSISAYMFNYCTSLTEIIIPSNITFIGYGAFYGCSSLSKIYIMKSHEFGLITGSLFMFAETNYALKIYFMNQSTLDAYSSHTNWSTYKSKFLVNTPIS